MKTKIVKSTILVAILGVALWSCNKPEVESPIESKVINENVINSEEINSILTEINSEAELPPNWWKKVVRWVKAHTGGSQKYIDGQPACIGTGGCGPCAGICFSIWATPISGNTGNLSQNELQQGLRPFVFGIIENVNTNEVKVLLEFHEYTGDFIQDGFVRIENEELIDGDLTLECDCNSIKLLPGDYPVFENDTDGTLQTIVNAVTN